MAAYKSAAYVCGYYEQPVQIWAAESTSCFYTFFWENSRTDTCSVKPQDFRNKNAFVKNVY
jgi:hypothetical protein